MPDFDTTQIYISGSTGVGKKIKQTEKGKVIKNLHYVNDSIWSLELKKEF